MPLRPESQMLPALQDDAEVEVRDVPCPFRFFFFLLHLVMSFWFYPQHACIGRTKLKGRSSDHPIPHRHMRHTHTYRYIYICTYSWTRCPTRLYIFLVVDWCGDGTGSLTVKRQSFDNRVEAGCHCKMHTSGGLTFVKSAFCGVAYSKNR